MTSLIGWNVEGGDLGNRRDTIIAELKSYRANWHLCLGDLGLALSLRNHVEKGVIYRVFDPFNEWTIGSAFDNDFWQRHSPDSIIAHLKLHYAAHLDKFVWSVGNNEPSTQGKTRDFVKWCVDLMHLGKQHGIRFAIAEIASAKSINHDEIKAGLWDEFIRVLNQYRGYHIATFHEYTTGILPATCLPDYPLNLARPQDLRQQNWQHAKLNLDTIDGNYHLGRGALITHVRAKQIGIEPLPFVITECAFDWMADVINSPARQTAIENLQRQFQLAPHDPLRGSTGHYYYHLWLMSQDVDFKGDWNDYLFEQYLWLAKAYSDECEGFCIFALNVDWDIPEGHDMSQPRNDKFRQLVIHNPVRKITVTTPTPIEFDPPLFDADVLVSIGYWNLRANMSATATDIGDLTTTAQRMKVSKETKNANGYDWYKFKQERTTGTITGYFANTDKLRITYVDSPVPPDVPSEPEPPTDTPTPTPDTLSALVAAEVAKQFETVNLDVPVGDVTITVPRVLLPALAEMWYGQAIFYSGLWKAAKRANGDLLAEDAADAIFAAVVPFNLDDLFSNVSVDDETLAQEWDITATEFLEDDSEDENVA